MTYYIMPFVFLVGIIMIALEDKIKINKAATAMLTAIVLWLVYILAGGEIVNTKNILFQQFITDNPEIAKLDIVDQCKRFIVNNQIISELGDVSTTLFFVISAMTIIELIDIHGGFFIITKHIHAYKKRRMVWLVAFMTFFMAAIMDNIAAGIVVIAMLRKIIPHQQERWIFSCLAIMAANAGGCWTPVGDVTTIILWTNGNITPLSQISKLILPALAFLTTATFIISRFFDKEDTWDQEMMQEMEKHNQQMMHVNFKYKSRLTMLVMGIASMAFVPVFNILTDMPPFMGLLLGLVVLWIYTDILYGHETYIAEEQQYRVAKVLSRIDLSTIIFFLGILMSVGALKSAGQLIDIADDMNKVVSNPLIIAFITGIVSSILDNVALVAATTGMYPIGDAGLAEIGSYFAVDGSFWTFLAYCAVTGGSILIIGSATGVTVMGLEKISFTYYLKRFSLIAFSSYCVGAAVFLLINYLTAL